MAHGYPNVGLHVPNVNPALESTAKDKRWRYSPTGFLDNFKIGPKIIGGYVVAALAMAVLAYMLLSSISSLNDKFDFLVHHDTPVLSNAHELTGLMVDMETGLRGYMVTGQTGYLDPYHNGKAKFEEVMAEEQELTSDNPAAVATLQGIHELEQEWLNGYSVDAIALREEVEAGAVAQSNFAEISARTIGKEKFDGIREILGGITAKFEATNDLEGRFLMESITLDLVNMETGQRGFLLTGVDASLDPYIQGQAKLTEDIRLLKNHDSTAAGVSVAEIEGIQVAVTGWKEAAAQPEIDARIEVRSYPKTMADIIALVNSGRGKESMDVIRGELGEFLGAEVALNEVRAADVASQASSALTMGIGVAVAAIAVMMVIGFFLSRNIVSGVNVISGALRRIAVGDVEAEANIRSKDEIGDMARSYGEMKEYLVESAGIANRIGNGDLTVSVNPRSEDDALGNAFSRMVTNLGDLIGEVRSTASDLGNASSQLASAAQQAGESTQGMSATTQQLASGAEQQSESVDSTTTAVGQLTQAIDQIAAGSQEQAGQVNQASTIVGQVSQAVNDVAENAQAAATGSQEANEAARSGADMVGKTVEGMEKIESAVSMASEKITELGTQSAEIGKIVTVIDDIAAQTNLLALNAAIEAARACEQGRGFAVVADEVRKLAERVTDVTKEIASLIDTVQKGVDESIKATEDGAREVSEGALQAQETGKVLEQILSSVEVVSGQIEQISAAAEEVSASSDEMVKTIDSVSAIVEQNSAATEQMTANSDEVARSMESVAGVTQQSGAAAQEMSASAERMSAQVEEVVASAQTLSDMSTTLQQAVSAFKINDKATKETSAKVAESEDEELARSY